MSKILELREKRAKAWDAAKAFLDTKRGGDGLLSAEDTSTYDKMEADVVALGKEIERLERQSVIDAELSKATSNPITNTPSKGTEEKTGRASAEYKRSFWNAMRTRAGEGLDPAVRNALQIGTDTEGGYLVPDEFERNLVEALEEENIFRRLANVITTSSGDRKIPVVASKGTASWIDEEGAIPESDDSFGQVSIGAQLGVTTAGATAITLDEVLDLFYSLKAPYRNKAVFVMNDSTVKAIRKLKDSQGQYLWQPSIQAGTSDTILNRPLYTSAYVPAIAAAAKTVAFGDFSYYWVADRQGRVFKRINELYAATGQVGFIATQRVDGKLILPEAVKVLQQKAS